ncbi:protein kintoun [Hyperolius riggenbachi]|uniref:protein kintoun n=1 Tax=Hyperolius riggenbachi TaxID=752182 RepID=UPI0035A3C392
MAARMEELNVTSEELERFRTAFQDARFRELFAQYAEEISDPENRRRYEREISEMERERGMDVQFIHPQPDHVLQTSLGGQQTCYLNVCSNALVRQPQWVPGKDSEGRPGQHWSLPCSLTPAREQLSPEGNKEVIYDVIFHPDTLHLATKSDRFKTMVDLTALDTVAKSFKVVLDTANVTTISEKYKGVPQASVIRKPHPGAKPKPQDPNDPLTFPYPYKVPGDQKESCHNQTKPKKVRPVSSEIKVGSISGECKPCWKPTIPHYTIRHRSYVDIQDYRDARDSTPSPVPKELVITVDLPLLNSASEADLKIEGKALSLESQKPAYKLDLKLPYLVEEERGTAQFNKSKKQLVITLPVVQQNIPMLMQDPVSKVSESESNSTICNPQEASGTQEILPSGQESVTAESAQNCLPHVSPECPIFTCSQNATSLTLVIHVKDIDENSITSEVSSYQCEIRFCVKHTNVAYVLFVQFLPQYSLNTDYIAVNVSEDNTVIELTKTSECFGLWKNLYFGVNSNSLQERRFIDEENVAEFLESGLRPSTIPWSTLEDQPLIDVLDMNAERTHIRLNKPELEEERYRAQRERYADLSKVKKQISYQSDDTSQSDIEGRGEDSVPDPGLQDDSESQSVQPEDTSAEDQGLCFTVIPPGPLDGDDIPEVVQQEQSPDLQNSDPAPILKEVDRDGRADIIYDHKTQCAFRFDNALLFDLD